VEFLVRSNARKYVASESGMTPISIVIELSKPSMIRCLARNGYNINKVSVYFDSRISTL